MSTEIHISNLCPGDTCRLPMIGYELTVIRKSAGNVRVRHEQGESNVAPGTKVILIRKAVRVTPPRYSRPDDEAVDRAIDARRDRA